MRRLTFDQDEFDSPGSDQSLDLITRHRLSPFKPVRNQQFATGQLGPVN